MGVVLNYNFSSCENCTDQEQIEYIFLGRKGGGRFYGHKQCTELTQGHSLTEREKRMVNQLIFLYLWFSNPALSVESSPPPPTFLFIYSPNLVQYSQCNTCNPVSINHIHKRHSIKPGFWGERKIYIHHWQPRNLIILS